MNLAAAPLRRAAADLTSRVAFHGVRRWCRLRPFSRRGLPAGTRAVSITFDDFPASAVEVGGALVAEAGGAATYYCCLSLLGRSDGFELRHIDQLREMGHELACHSFDHPNLLFEPDWRIVASVEENARALARLGRGQLAPHFAFPYGMFRPATRGLLGKRFHSLRTIHPGAHFGQVDLMSLNSTPLLRDTKMDRIEAQLRAVAEAGGWLTLFTHEIDPSPTPYGTTPAALARVVTLCKQLGLELCSVGQMVERLG